MPVSQTRRGGFAYTSCAGVGDLRFEANFGGTRLCTLCGKWQPVEGGCVRRSGRRRMCTVHRMGRLARVAAVRSQFSISGRDLFACAF